VKTMRYVASTDQGEVWKLDPPAPSLAFGEYEYVIYPPNDPRGWAYVLNEETGGPHLIGADPLHLGYLVQP